MKDPRVRTARSRPGRTATAALIAQPRARAQTLDRAVAVVGQRVMLMLKAGLPQAPIKAANSKK